MLLLTSIGGFIILLLTSIGGVIILLLTLILPNENTGLLVECEKDLPRSQNCILIAVENDK